MKKKDVAKKMKVNKQRQHIDNLMKEEKGAWGHTHNAKGKKVRVYVPDKY